MYRLLTLPHPIKATRNFFSGIFTARLSNDDNKAAAPAAAVYCKNFCREIGLLITIGLVI
jgi:hypothetical protein